MCGKVKWRRFLGSQLSGFRRDDRAETLASLMKPSTARTLIDEFPKSQPLSTLHKHLATKFPKVDKPERQMLRRPKVHQRATTKIEPVAQLKTTTTGLGCWLHFSFVATQLGDWVQKIGDAALCLSKRFAQSKMAHYCALAFEMMASVASTYWQFYVAPLFTV